MQKMLIKLIIVLVSCAYTIGTDFRFNAKAVNLAPRDPKDSDIAKVANIANVVWNLNNHGITNYFRITQVINATEQLDTSGLFNLYVTLTKTECLKSDIKSWDFSTIEETKNCQLTNQNFVCPMRVLYQPWRATGTPVKLLSPIPPKTFDNSICFLLNY